jgi:predicted RNA-binding Zn-ribbon protein involved in translation (DUF1610 family)
MATLTEPTDPATLTVCPACGSDVLNAQGIYTCSTCSWVAPEYR